MREITSHRATSADDQLTITVMDEPGAGGGNHRYVVTGAAFEKNPSFDDGDLPMPRIPILFQNGPINEHGVNGITQEVLLAIVIDRLESFQNGSFANEYNAKALDYVRAAQETLLSRTCDRMARGVEGKSEK